MVGRLMRVWLPWTVNEYPGGGRFVAGICGLKVKTVEAWFYDDGALPPKHAAVLAAMCRSQAEQFTALAIEFEARAAERPKYAGRAAKAQRERRLLRDV